MTDRPNGSNLNKVFVAATSYTTWLQAHMEV